MASKNISKIVASTSVITLLAPTILQTVSVNADQTQNQNQVTQTQATSSSTVGQSTPESSNTSTSVSASDETKTSDNVSQETSTTEAKNETTLKTQEPKESTTTTVNAVDPAPASNAPVVNNNTDLTQKATSMTRMRSMSTQDFISQVAEQARSVAAQNGLYAWLIMQ